MKVYTIAHIPDALHQRWLQHLRDFDVANASCHFEVFSEAPDVSMADVLERLRIEPGLTFTQIFERPK